MAGEFICSILYRGGRLEEAYRGSGKEESLLNKSYQSCKFSQVTKHQNVR
jgi:hypothetical protein